MKTAFKIKELEWMAIAAEEGFARGSVITTAEIETLGEKHFPPTASGNIVKPWWLINNLNYRAGRGEFRIPAEGDPAAVPVAKPASVAPVAAASVPEVIADPAMESAAAIGRVATLTDNAIPEKFRNYVPFGAFKDVHTIINSGMFYPMFITGLSGNGKTLMTEQACAKARRECFRVNITMETDEDDLIGGFRLKNDETVWHDGPVIQAYERGAVLLLDELDLATNKIMCLQSILEGKSTFLIKKTGRLAKQGKGFTVVATGNTKGKGNDDGMFVGTNVLNEAFLERFPITIEQEYPSIKIETKILTAELIDAGQPDAEFAARLCEWSRDIRKTYFEGGCEDIISTRRLVHIAKAYGIFGADRVKALSMCLARFDDETKDSFLELYKKLDAKAAADALVEAARIEEEDRIANLPPRFMDEPEVKHSAETASAKLTSEGVNITAF